MGGGQKAIIKSDRRIILTYLIFVHDFLHFKRIKVAYTCILLEYIGKKIVCQALFLEKPTFCIAPTK